MNATRFIPSPFRRFGTLQQLSLAAAAALLFICCYPAAWSGLKTPAETGRSGTIPAAEFSRLSQQFSETGGEFGSDNLTSNERLYLDVLGKLKELTVSGGAYIGVGPEQNFTYIAKIRPQIAFIVDIRRQAIIQHMMYKAIFHLAPSRAEFLSWLFSKPLSADNAEQKLALDPLLDSIRSAPTSEQTMLDNLAVIRKTIEETFQFPLTPEDARALQTLYRTFWRDDLDVGFRFGHNLNIPGTPFGFPTLADLIEATDQNGRQGNFLAHESDYQFVRGLEEQNRVIPVVGDFTGSHALASVANYLRAHRYTVSAFYTSNVEEYLFENNGFGAFAANVCRLPISKRSVIVRAVRSHWAPHSHWSAHDRITPFLQKIGVFCADFQEGRFTDYYSLVTTDFISAEEPVEDTLPSPAASAPQRAIP